MTRDEAVSAVRKAMRKSRLVWDNEGEDVWVNGHIEVLIALGLLRLDKPPHVVRSQPMK